MYSTPKQYLISNSLLVLGGSFCDTLEVRLSYVALIKDVNIYLIIIDMLDIISISCTIQC